MHVTKIILFTFPLDFAAERGREKNLLQWLERGALLERREKEKVWKKLRRRGGRKAAEEKTRRANKIDGGRRRRRRKGDSNIWEAEIFTEFPADSERVTTPKPPFTNRTEELLFEMSGGFLFFFPKKKSAIQLLPEFGSFFFFQAKFLFLPT